MDVIQKVRACKPSGQKLITIPKHCDLEVGDYVRVTKVVLPVE